jgi:hypothetical protein
MRWMKLKTGNYVSCTGKVALIQDTPWLVIMAAPYRNGNFTRKVKTLNHFHHLNKE